MASTFLQVHYSDGGNAEFLLTGLSDYVVGRSVKKGTTLAEVGLEDQFVSRRHCRFFWSGAGGRGNWMVEDAGSSNGTKLNGFPVLGVTPVPEGGEIYIGTCRLTLSSEPHRYPRVALTGRAAGREVSPPLAGGLDAQTVIVPPPEPTMIHRSGMTPIGDRTMVRPAAPASAVRDATMVQPAAASTTLVRDSLVADRDGGGATVVRKTRSDATLAPGKEEEEPSPPARREAGGDRARLSEGQTLTGRPPTVPPLSAARKLGLPPGEGESTGISGAASLRARGGAEVEATMAGTLHTRQLGEGEATKAGEGLDELARHSLEDRLIRQLLQSNYLDRQDVLRLLREVRQSGQTFFGILARDTSLLFKTEIFRMVAREYQWELIEDEQSLSDLAVSTDWLPYHRALEEGMVVLRSPHPHRTRYATIDPFNLVNQDWVVRCGGLPADKVLVHPNCFVPTLSRLKVTVSQDELEVGVAINITSDEDHQIREQITDVDVPQVVNYFLHRAHLQKASDIHVEPTEELLVVRNRVDGILHEEITMPQALHAEVSSRLKIMSGMDVAEKRRPQDGRFGVIIRDNPIDVRVSSYPTVYGEKIVMRLLDKNALRPSIASLGLLARDLRMLKDKLNAPYGLLMISGPTGSGKTTTLYSCLSSMDKNTRNVLTVEDPVEYRLKGVHQMQVNHKIGLTFASGLRTILRQDPDVIMVGEIRDPETAAMAVQASLTGHIVFSTIHTNDAVGVLTRMLDMGIEPFLVATSVSMAIAQRLVRKVCAHCRQPISGQEVLENLRRDGVSDERLRMLGLSIDPDMDFAQGLGCRHCRNSGYSGRRPVFEVFEMTEEARNMIMSPEMNADDIRQHAKKNGMTTLLSHGMKLVEEEVTTVAEVIRVLGE